MLPAGPKRLRTLVQGVPSPYAAVLLDRDRSVAGADTLYVADDSASPGGGVLKFSFDGVSWTPRGSFRPAGSELVISIR